MNQYPYDHHRSYQSTALFDGSPRVVSVSCETDDYTVNLGFHFPPTREGARLMELARSEDMRAIMRCCDVITAKEKPLQMFINGEPVRHRTR